jgi:hypothetical protein
MFISRKRKFSGVVSLLLAGCFMMTSCSLLPGKSNKAPEEIESVVSDYMDSIAGGDFADDSYESDLATDTPFAELKFSDEAVEEIMKSALEKISYEIDSADGDQKDGEGSCDIVLTAIDVDAVTEALEGKFDAEMLQAAINDKDAPTEDHKITLDLEYDEDEEVWLISDTSELSEILGEPFAALELSSASDPAEVAEAFLEALKAGDFDTASALTDGYYTEADFIDSSSGVSAELFDIVFSDMTYEIIEPSTSSDTEISFQVDYSYADFWTSLAAISNDVQVMSDLVKPYILASANYEDGEVEYEEYLKTMGEMVVADLQSSSAVYDETDTIDLYYDDIQETWFVENVPYSLFAFYDLEYTVDPMYIIDTIVLDEIILDAYNDLLASGSITQAQYDEYFTPVVYDSATVLASIVDQGWYDEATEAFVTAYTPAVTSLQYDIYFSQEFPGLVLNCEFYNVNGTVLWDSFQLKMEPGWTHVYFYDGYKDSSALEKDTYRVVISLADGTILADQSITVG